MKISLAFAYMHQQVYESMKGFYLAYGLPVPPEPKFEIEDEPEWSLED